jgi:Cadherin-like
VTFNPTLDVNGPFSITTRISDGVAPALTGSKAFSGIAVNDAPTASNLNTAQVYTEDTALNLVDVVASDVDNATLTVTLTLSNPAAGALSAGTAGLVTASYDTATGTWSASGPTADVNALLAGVIFTPTLDFNGGFAIATSVSDGVAPPVTGVQALAGIGVNDAPQLTFLGSLPVLEGSTTVLSAAQFQARDVDHGSAQLAYVVDRLPSHGVLQLGGVSLAAGQSFSQADLDAGLVSYRHDASETTTDALDFTLFDGQMAGPSARLNISMAPVNDEVPVFVSPQPTTVLLVQENTQAQLRYTAVDADLPVQTLMFSVAGGADAALFDVDAATGELRFKTLPDYEAPRDSGRDNRYEVDVRVSDGALSSVQRLTIAVTEVNDNVPTFAPQNAAVFEVLEGSVNVSAVLATDGDQPAPALVYSIVGGVDAAQFQIDAGSGALRFVTPTLAVDPKDSDRDNSYELILQVSDGSQTVRRAFSVQVRAVQVSPTEPVGPVEVPTAPKPNAEAKTTDGQGAPDGAVKVQDLAIKTAADTDAAAPLEFTALGSGSDSRVGRLFELVQRSSTANGSLQSDAQRDAAAQRVAVAPAPPDLQSLEAALGLPTNDVSQMQTQSNGQSLAALAAQAAARAATVIEGPLTTAVPAEGKGPGDDAESVITAMATPTVTGGLAFSATLLFWVTRAGGLMAAMMASVPAWRTLDPMPILKREDDDDRVGFDDDPASAHGPGDANPLRPNAPPGPSTTGQDGARQLLQPLELQA